VRAIFSVSTVSVVLAVLVAASPARAATQFAAAHIFDSFDGGPGGIGGISDPVVVDQSSSTGLPIQVWRAPGTGTYTVSLGGMYAPGLPHNIQVTMAQSREILCAPTSEGGLNNDFLVTVQCYTSQGQPSWLATSLLTILYRMDDSPSSEVAGYAWNSGNTLVSSWSSKGGTNTLSHVSVGHYTFTFGGLSPAGTGGTVMVSTRTPFTRCATAGWAGALTVKVVCTATSTSLGSFRDANVSVYFGDQAIVSRGNWGFARADQPSQTFTYTPAPNYQRMSNFGTVTVTREGVGFYEVLFPGIGTTSGSPGYALAVPYGNSDTICTAASSGSPNTFQVLCTQNGAGVDSVFVIEAFRP
jgi:hypothetical protein